MDHRSEDIEFVRSVGSPSVDEDTSETHFAPPKEEMEVGNDVVVEENEDEDVGADLSVAENGGDDSELPQCKIKRNYLCNLCPFYSQNPRSFLYHSRDVHFDKIKIYECSQCLYASKHSQKLQRHISMIHVPGKVRKARNKMIRSDRKEPRPIMPKPVESPPEEPLKGDAGEALDGGEAQCSLCHFRHRNPKLVRRHEKIAHLKKKYLKCNMCTYITHVRARFTKHVKYHSMPMIKCDLCDFRTPYKWNLDRHCKNHSGMGAFQCSKCNFRADIKQSLTVHEMNHHVPPVGQGAVAARKKNKVGASETQTADTAAPEKEESDSMGLEHEDSELEADQEAGGGEGAEEKKAQVLRNVKAPYSSKRESANNSHMQADFIHPDDIVPRYGQIFVKNLKCKFCSYKAVFSHEIWRHEKRIHGYVRPENKKENAPKRPPPKLIPIQNKANSNPILKIPVVKNKPPTPFPQTPPLDKPVNETEFNEMCKKSSLTSSLKDFVSLIGDEEGLKTIPDSSREDLDAECSRLAEESTEAAGGDLKQKQTDLLKKKNASFFDKLKEKLMTGGNEDQSLFCESCGHESKCLSEAVAHQKRHSTAHYKSDSDSHPENDIVLTGAELSSTRCQHCRQRCKTSTDLINHLKSCKAFEASLDPATPDDLADVEIKTEEISLGSEMSEEDTKPMENRVFVWNDLGQVADEEEEGEGMDVNAQPNDEPLATSPGFGTVTSKGYDNTESGTIVMEANPRLKVIVKKVFKCPHCSFWASTASRFHVHIVGHLNKKPFECSLCLYRSNWRWDITKHIRLKSLRDPSHSAAKVNMTDETGRRNYSKYNKFLTLMRVQEPTAESSGYGRRSRPGDATQGTVSDKDIVTLPAPPRLTRAPAPGVPHRVPQGLPLRPPPPLKAAHQLPAHPDAPKNSKDPVKKSFWKCKKCNFRDSQKGRVLLHVKKHYMFKKNEKGQSKTSKDSPVAAARNAKHRNPELKSLLKTPSYSCGHCHQISNWKHVIQRHCKLKHNGDALIQVRWREGSFYQDGKSKDGAHGSSNTISCDICPFTTNTEGDLTAHKLNHVDRPGSIFKCTFCPFYVPSKIAVLEHMEIHGCENGVDMYAITVDNFNPREELLKKHTGETAKKYKCLHCPYISNSRSQFLYHKQFHRPRNSPFKCLYCSYNVSRRHLLHQHLRVHHNREEKSSVCQEIPEEPHGSCDPAEPEGPALKEEPLDEEEGEEKAEKPEETGEQETGGMEAVEPGTGGERPGEVEAGGPESGELETEALETEEVKIEEPDVEEQDLEELKVEEPEQEAQEAEGEGPEGEGPEGEGPEGEGPETCPIPLVWVVKSGTIQKMYKCRWCPHVNLRKVNIQEHEKMHKPGESKKSGGLKLQCSECNYTCNNAGVLASHVKVHQGFYGQIRSVVDKTRPESEQIQELENSLRMMEPEVVVIEDSSQEVEIVEPEALSSHPESAYTTKSDANSNDDCRKILSFCDKCPGRFFYKKELRIHSKFHMIHLPFRCSFCSYTARQRPHLLAHYKVHGQEYREKTLGLIELYAVSPEHPQPKTVVIKKESNVMEGPVWAVKSAEGVSKGEGKPVAKHACSRCPAKFFKAVALQYHLSLHGANHQHKCKHCDYSVKTYGNLIKHQLIHQEKSKGGKFSYSFPITGRDLRHQPDVQGGAGEKPSEGRVEESMVGSPEFIYPTYVKKGKVREKKYKCQKCPCAFEKREQYRVHVSLHGSKQKYQCEKCDYSVKYYANYMQHMRKHESHEEALKAKRSDGEKVRAESGSSDGGEEEKRGGEGSPFKWVTLHERKKPSDGKEEDKKTYYCGYCPYSVNRRDEMDYHSLRHYLVSGIKSGFECTHCDYSTTQSRSLREHQELHFNSKTRYKAEAYLKCEKMELWCCNEDAKDPKEVLVFQDRGEEEPNRYFPPVEKSDAGRARGGGKRWGPNAIRRKVPSKNAEVPNPALNEELIDMIEEQVEEVLVKETKPRRFRGKKWKCKKCPHAFGKKDQYLRHAALHGSNQRHQCDICDYSVKFYTNYVQHMRMHQTHEPDKVIHVKKSFQSFLESLKRSLSEPGGEEWGGSGGEEGGDNGGGEGEGEGEGEGDEYSEKLVIDEGVEEKEDCFQLQRARG